MIDNFMNLAKIAKSSILFFIMLCALTLVSCYTPSPLYGTFSDNLGNSITFIQDGTYVATIGGNNFEGTYVVLENVVTFSQSTGDVINSEWDIRGNILYITWTLNSGTTELSLYRTA